LEAKLEIPSLEERESRQLKTLKTFEQICVSNVYLYKFAPDFQQFQK